MSVIALIPARGGSKRLPRKNLAPCAGKPLVVWSIKAALASELVDHVYVSTEDAEIAAVARDHGAGIINRPLSLATDQATSDDVVKHACGALDQAHPGWRWLVLLQPTSPARDVADINACITLSERSFAATHTSDSSQGVHNGSIYVIPSRMRIIPRTPSMAVRAPVVDIDTAADLARAEKELLGRGARS